MSRSIEQRLEEAKREQIQIYQRSIADALRSGGPGVDAFVASMRKKIQHVQSMVVLRGRNG